jgi:hypothetical protein
MHFDSSVVDAREFIGGQASLVAPQAAPRNAIPRSETSRRLRPGRDDVRREVHKGWR